RGLRIGVHSNERLECPDRVLSCELPHFSGGLGLLRPPRLIAGYTRQEPARLVSFIAHRFTRFAQKFPSLASFARPKAAQSHPIAARATSETAQRLAAAAAAEASTGGTRKTIFGFSVFSVIWPPIRAVSYWYEA